MKPQKSERVAIVKDDAFGIDSKRADWLSRTLAKADVQSEFISYGQLADSAEVGIQQFGLVAIPDAERFPAIAKPNLMKFLAAGGNLLVMGGTPFENMMVNHGDEWKTAGEVLLSAKPEKLLFDFSKEDFSNWSRVSNNPASPASLAADASGPEGHPSAMRVEISNLTNHDIFVSPALAASPFAAGETLTTFWAKGTSRQQRLSVRWYENDGSIWVVAVSLTPQWKYYVLRPSNFRIWRMPKPVPGRGGKGDAFHPDEARHIAFGLAKSHSQIQEGPHTLRIAGVGTAENPLGDLDVEPPMLEAMSPPYKLCEHEGTQHIRPLAFQAILAEPAEFAPIKRLVSPAWRWRGLTTHADSDGRWIPILESYDADGIPRGIAASMFVSTAEPTAGAAWAYIGIPELEDFEPNADAIGLAVSAIVRAMLRGLYILNAGAEEFAFFSGQAVPVGARVANFSNSAARICVRLSVSASGGPVVENWSEEIDLAPGEIREIQHTWQPDENAAGGFEAVGELAVEGTTVDRIVHEFTLVGGHGADAAELVTVEGGDFRLGGEKWNPHGINYWPLSAIGLEPTRYYSHWLHPTNYDPVVIERDLAQAGRLGMNMLTIKYDRPLEGPAVADFLSRCRRHGIKVNVFIQGTDPMRMNEELAVDLIRSARLWKSDSMFAYDIAWEPRVGNYVARVALDGEWRDWVAEQYGSEENAEADWGIEPPRDEEGNLTGPSDEQLINDGPWRAMVAAYRRFLDDLIGRRINRVRRLILRLDPHHLIGYRAGFGGTGQSLFVHFIPFDMLMGAKHLDFTSPEAYDMPNDWSRARETGFITAYSRYSGNGKPVFWSEFGTNTWPDPTPEREQEKAAFWESMYRVILDSGANGLAGWWWPAGYRVNENSCFGVINADRTLTPAAEIAEKYAPDVATIPTHSEPDVWLTIDRDEHTQGLAGIWARHKAEYIEAREAGKSVGVRTAGTDTTSADVPLVAVGNIPYNGHGPLKFLNAEFNWLKVLDARGEWVEVEDGGSVEVEAGQAVRISASVGNTGEALWLAPKSEEVEKGSVCLVVEDASGNCRQFAICADVPRYGDADLADLALDESFASEAAVVIFRMAAVGRAAFGEQLRVTLKYV